MSVTRSEEFKQNLSDIWTGVPKPDATRAKMAAYSLNRTPAHLAALAAANKKGTAHPNWTGDDATYRAVHKRLVKARGKADHCAHCHTDDGRKFYWAYTGPGHDEGGLHYSTNFDDYIPLCMSCHKIFDKDTGRKR